MLSQSFIYLILQLQSCEILGHVYGQDSPLGTTSCTTPIISQPCVQASKGNLWPYQAWGLVLTIEHVTVLLVEH